MASDFGFEGKTVIQIYSCSPFNKGHWRLFEILDLQNAHWVINRLVTPYFVDSRVSQI